MYQAWVSGYFKKYLKPLTKKNRYLKQELRHALVHFDKRLSIPLGKDLYKIRLPGWNRGKSGGYRLYVYLIEIQSLVTPIFIHSKKERDNIDVGELVVHAENVERELRILFF